MTFRTGPVGGWNGCPDPRIVAGLTRGEGHGARLTMGAVSSSSSYTLRTVITDHRRSGGSVGLDG